MAQYQVLKAYWPPGALRPVEVGDSIELTPEEAQKQAALGRVDLGKTSAEKKADDKAMDKQMEAEAEYQADADASAKKKKR
jgi:hypothetical protein